MTSPEIQAIVVVEETIPSAVRRVYDLASVGHLSTERPELCIDASVHCVVSTFADYDSPVYPAIRWMVDLISLAKTLSTQQMGHAKLARLAEHSPAYHQRAQDGCECRAVWFLWSWCPIGSRHWRCVRGVRLRVQIRLYRCSRTFAVVRNGRSGGRNRVADRSYGPEADSREATCPEAAFFRQSFAAPSKPFGGRAMLGALCMWRSDCQRAELLDRRSVDRYDAANYSLRS